MILQHYNICYTIEKRKLPLCLLHSPLFCRNILHQFSSKSSLKDHYQILNLPRNCTNREIKDAFITLSKKFHPDKNKGDPKAQQQFIEVNEAYNVLIKPESRKRYTDTLEYYGSPVAGARPPGQGGFYKVHRRDSGGNQYYGYSGPYYNPQTHGQGGSHKPLRWQTRNTTLKWYIMASVGLVIFIQISRLLTISQLTNYENSEEERQLYRALARGSDLSKTDK